MASLAATRPTPVDFAFAADLDALPGEIDVAIVATGATSRREVVERLLAGRRIGALVLDKFPLAQFAIRTHLCLGG